MESGIFRSDELGLCPLAKQIPLKLRRSVLLPPSYIQNRIQQITDRVQTIFESDQE